MRRRSKWSGITLPTSSQMRRIMWCDTVSNSSVLYNTISCVRHGIVKDGVPLYSIKWSGALYRSV